jgi:subtilisin
MDSTSGQGADADHELPAWGLERQVIGAQVLPSAWPLAEAREWAWGGSRGSGVSVCVLDSGVDASHPLVGAVQRSVAVELDAGDRLQITADDRGDLFGHGTACAGIIRALAPDCELHSVRVLGPQLTGSGDALLTGMRWAVEQGFDVINLSLSTRRKPLIETLYELTDEAYFGRSLIVAAAHNLPVESYPWRFAAVVSVASHEGSDRDEFFYNPRPPVEFFAPGLDVEVAWLDGATIRASGNSFAAPHIAGRAALILSKHGRLEPFELKTALRTCANNVSLAA